VEDRLLSELQALLEACRQRGVAVFVIGGFGVRAYGSLLRRTLDLDLAVVAGAWLALAEVLKAQGFHLSAVGIWATATKGEREARISALKNWKSLLRITMLEIPIALYVARWKSISRRAQP